MQNAQNTEIQQRVMNLVELYRTKVGKESQMAKDLAEEYKRQYDNEIDFAYALHEQGFEGYCLNIHIPEEAIDEIRVNEHLLGHFYKEVAGDDADLNVLSYFLAEKYDSAIFSEEEVSFLKDHFVEMVNYIIQTPNNDLQGVEGDDRNDLYLLPQEVLDLVRERVSIPKGSKVYNPFTGFAQLACLYKDCSFFCEESYKSYFNKWNAYCDKIREVEHIVEHKVDENKLYAWMKVALYANSMDAIVIEDGLIPQEYDAVISYIPYIPSKVPNYAYYYASDNSSDAEIIGKIIKTYQNLANGGKMILIFPTEYCWKKVALSSVERTSYRLELEALWKQLIADNSLVEIIQLPSVMGKTICDAEHCIIVAEKGFKGNDVTFIDARSAFQKSDGILFKQTLDLDALHTMMENGGKENNTGLRKYVQIPRTAINSDLLVPQVYVLEKPSEYDAPVPLSNLSSIIGTRIYEVNFDLPEDTPWVGVNDLSSVYKGELDVNSLERANCPNNPKDWKYGTRAISRLAMAMSAVDNSITAEDAHISHYRNCTYLDGSKDAVLFKVDKEGVHTALLRATGKPVAVSSGITVFCANDNIDALSLIGYLNMPIVYRQVQVFSNYGVEWILKGTFVPTSKRIVLDMRERLLNEEKAYKAIEDKYIARKTEYVNEVRMRKHDMGQYIFELMNIEDLMRYYIENREKEKDYYLQIKDLLDNFRTSLGELSSLLDNLSREEQFGAPDYAFDINEFLKHLNDRHKTEGFKITYTRNQDSVNSYCLQKMLEEGMVDPDDPVYDYLDETDDNNAPSEFPNNSLHKRGTGRGEDFNVPSLTLSESDFARLVNNIIDNARKHGFTDTDRKDYEVKIRLSIDEEKEMLQIDFCNNGNPLPDGMNKMRYGIKGEKAGKTAGTGLGGNYVKQFVEHYEGDYDIFMEDGWTVVRICLPIK